MANINSQELSKQSDKLSLQQMMFHQKTITTLEKCFNDKAKSEKFANALVSMYNSNPALQKCNLDSIYYAAMKSAELGLPLDNHGLAYIIPYNGKAQFQISYRGYLRLAMRTGRLESINIVKMTDNYTIEYDEVGNMRLIKLRDNPTSSNITGYFGYLKYRNGFSTTTHSTKEEIERHARRFSVAYDSIWKNHFDAMAEKTIIKRLLSRYIVDADDVIINDAINSDQAVITEQGYDYVDNPRTSEKQEFVAGLENAFSVSEDDTFSNTLENFVTNKDNSTEFFADKEPSALTD